MKIDVISICFEVSGEPVGKARPRFTRSGHVYTPQKTKDYERHISQAAFVAMAEANLGVTDRSVAMEIIAAVEIPKSWSKKKQTEAELGGIKPKKPDIDNIAKAVMDGCNSIVYVDDAQVNSLRVKKVYAAIGSEGYVQVSISWT